VVWAESAIQWCSKFIYRFICLFFDFCILFCIRIAQTPWQLLCVCVLLPRCYIGIHAGYFPVPPQRVWRTNMATGWIMSILWVSVCYQFVIITCVTEIDCFLRVTSCEPSQHEEQEDLQLHTFSFQFRRASVQFLFLFILLHCKEELPESARLWPSDRPTRAFLRLIIILMSIKEGAKEEQTAPRED
jgi:hypothetical protein